MRHDAGVGLGLRQPHYEAALERRADLAFVEVHSENFFAAGGATRAVLRRARELYEVSLHGVGLGLGSAAGIDGWHLERLAALVHEIEPVRISDHACFARAPRFPGGAVLHANDLLPVAFTPAALDIMVRNVGAVQERLRRPILVENLSAYVAFDDDVMSEAQFLSALCTRSGCGLLLDVNNLMVNALNADEPDPLAQCCATIDSLAPGLAGEIHLAGYAQAEQASPGRPKTLARPLGGRARSDRGQTFEWVIDDHGSRVRPAVWDAYRHALRRFGAVPTLIEWDTDVPAFEVLLQEADLAARCVRQVTRQAQVVPLPAPRIA